MVSNPIKTKYLLDTNILVEFYRWKPMSLKLNEFFWLEFTKKLENGEWVLLDVIVDEVKYENDLKVWCKEQAKNGFVKKISDDDRKRAVAINSRYKMIDQYTGKSTADTYLIAYAEKNSLGIFSRESGRVDTTKLYKIPDVCDVLHIKRLREPKAFLKAIGFN